MLDDYISTLWAKAVDTPFPPIPRRRCGDATVYVECRRGRYWLICEERGEEYWRREATDMDDAAFQLISIVLQASWCATASWSFGNTRPAVSLDRMTTRAGTGCIRKSS